MIARILVVDDEPDLETLIQQKYRHQIHGGAVNFLFACDGVEALTVLEANHDVDLVVTDINMPRMDGLSLLRKLQESEEKLSTIIVSAYGDIANIRTAMNRGAFDFLTKPIDFLDFETTIAKTIRHVEALREARRRQAEAERAHASLSRYFSPNLAERLASDVDAIDLGGQRREIATLFTDVAGFTALVEALEPDVLGPLLNDYLTGMTDLVFAHDGTVAKIVGDALHVLFGAPGEQLDHASRSVACALALDEYVRRASCLSGCRRSSPAPTGTGNCEHCSVVRHGSASNQLCNCSVTAANGSGRRRSRLAFCFGRAVGRTSPSCHAVRKPVRNCSSGGCSIAATISSVSAISTSRCCTARMSLSRRTGSSLVRCASTWRFISSDALGSAINR
jgi:CheY-like chemotaxis protein